MWLFYFAAPLTLATAACIQMVLPVQNLSARVLLE